MPVSKVYTYEDKHSWNFCFFHGKYHDCDVSRLGKNNKNLNKKEFKVEKFVYVTLRCYFKSEFSNVSVHEICWKLKQIVELW